MAQSKQSFLNALLVEILLQIVENSLIASPEHAEADNAGQYAPSKFDTTFLDIDRESRNLVVDSLSRNFAFIEVRRSSCCHRVMLPNVRQDFEDAFSMS